MNLAILQARMSSSRLPGKVLKTILGRPMLELQIERIKRCENIDRLVVATSTDSEDRMIVDLCKRLGVEFFTGDIENVLDRTYQAAKKYKPDCIIRLTGDCPLTDSELIDDLITFFHTQNCDYVSNTLPPKLPVGLDAEVFTFSALKRAWQEAGDPHELEHVTPFITRHPEKFDIHGYPYPRDLSFMRWTVDEPEDFVFVKKIYETLYPKNPGFFMADILELLERKPELIDINKLHKRNTKTLRD